MEWKLKIAYYVIAPPLIILIFATNILILVVIFNNEKLRVRTNVFVASWAVCDLLMGFILLAHVGVLAAKSLTHVASDVQHTAIGQRQNFTALEPATSSNLYLCVFWAGLQLVPALVSCLHWVALAFDRFLAIMDAVHYEERLTCKRLKYYVISMWVYGIVWSTIPFVWHNDVTSSNGSDACNLCMVLSKYYFLVIVIVHFLPCLLTTVCVFTKMFVHVRAHQRQVHVTHTMTQDKLLEDFEVARTYLMAFLCSVVFWSPFFICSLVGVAQGFPVYIQTVVSGCMLAGVACSGMKLPIYLIAHKVFRKSFKQLFDRKRQHGMHHRY